MNDQSWRKIFTLILLGLASLTLSGFSIQYFFYGNKQIAIIEASVALIMLFSFIRLIRGGNYFVSSIIGYIGVFGILLMLLLTGGIGGTGLIWWGLFPVIGYVMFGLRGGKIGLLTGSTILSFLAYISYKIPESLFFSFLEIRQTFFLVIVLGIIMHFFEKTAGIARQKTFEKTELLEKEIKKRETIEKELSLKINEIQEKNKKQDQLRAAMLNLLEDERELDIALKKEKEGVEQEVEKRTLELEEEKSKLFAVINSLSRGLIVINQKKEIILYNKSINIVLDITEKSIAYENIQEKLKGLVNLDELVQKTFEIKKESFFEPQLFGSQYITIHSVPIIHNNKVEAVIIFVKNVTEQLNLQRSRDEFFSIASHELRTPLTAIRGNAEMILDNYSDKLPDANVKEMLSDIHEGSLRLIEIVNDFLDLSRLEMKKIEFKNEPLNLSEVIHETIKELETTESRKKVSIQLEAPPSNIPLVLADKDRLKQVLINLIGNALKFTKEGSIHLGLSVQQADGLIEVSVTDTGNGIAPEQQSLLFHKFQQAGSSLYTRDTTKGTGLGLYICKLLIEGMGGTIWLKKSAIGEGSTFCFSLHIAKESKI